MNLEISITTDYTWGLKNKNYIDKLKTISKIGFTHIDWCEHWNDDFFYTIEKIKEIKKNLNKYRLKLLYVHGSAGKEYKWISNNKISKADWLSGIKLVINRMTMAQYISENPIVVMHFDREPKESKIKKIKYWDLVFRTFDILEEYFKKTKCKIALENYTYDKGYEIEKILENYSEEFLGVCYDSGHGNIGDKEFTFLKKFKNRLIALHLHDNNGKKDEHNILYSGNIDWYELAEIISQSSYKGPINLETCLKNSNIKKEEEFLKRCYEDAFILSYLIDKLK